MGRDAWRQMPGLREWKKLETNRKAKLFPPIKRLGDLGQCRNEQRFKHERNGIYAIKASQVRIHCFMTKDQRIVLTHVVLKKQEKARKAELDRAERIRRECTNG